jgi:putative endonuclease
VRNLLLAREKRYHVYIMASAGRVFYVGVTRSHMTRVLHHKVGEVAGFTKRYSIQRLVYYETFRYVNNAIACEKQIKGLLRKKKISLIEADNPAWEDLALGWGMAVSLRIADSSSPTALSE